MKVLNLTLKKRWFDMIASGEKKEEYRELKPYWHSRLLKKSYDAIRFRNGYSKSAPTMLVELLGIEPGFGSSRWGADKSIVYVLKLGKIIG